MPRQTQVNYRTRPIAIFWIVGVVSLSLASFAGGDTAVLAGWLYLAWTIPFGVIWWFYLYGHALTLLRPEITQVVGVVAVDIAAFVFWFIVVPRVYAITKRNTKQVPYS